MSFLKIDSNNGSKTFFLLLIKLKVKFVFHLVFRLKAISSSCVVRFQISKIKMDNYSWPSGKLESYWSHQKLSVLVFFKGENKVDEPLHSIQLDANAVHMQVKTGSKISNLIKFAATRFEVSATASIHLK